MLLRIWFVIVSMIAMICAVTMRPAAFSLSAPPALQGDYIQPVTRDGDIEQPEWYVPHDPPESEPVEEIPETPPEYDPPPAPPPVPDPDPALQLPDDDPAVEMEGEALEPAAPEDPFPDFSDWRIVGYGEPEVSPGADQRVPLGFSSDTELLAGIKSSIDGIFLCIMLLMSCGVVFLICRMVWPLFDSW